MPTVRATQGDTLTLTAPATTYTATAGWLCVFQVAGALGVTVPATMTGDAWVATVPSAQSMNLGSGVIEWVAIVRHTDGRQTTIQRGSVRLDPLPAQGRDDVLAPGQFARRRLAQLEKAILSLEDALESYSVGGRDAKRRDLESMYRERATLKREIAREEALADGNLAGPGITFRMPLSRGVLR